METLSKIVARVIADYESPSPLATMYYAHNEHTHIDLVLVIPNDRDIEPHIVVMTRLVGDQVVIEVDTLTSRKRNVTADPFVMA